MSIGYRRASRVKARFQGFGESNHMGGMGVCIQGRWRARPQTTMTSLRYGVNGINKQIREREEQVEKGVYDATWE